MQLSAIMSAKIIFIQKNIVASKKSCNLHKNNIPRQNIWDETLLRIRDMRMIVIKRFFTSLLATILISITVASAQNVEQLVEQKLSRMDIELCLSPKQSDALRVALKVNVESEIESRKLKGTPEFQIATKANYQTFQSALREILTPEQHQKWRAYIAEYMRAKAAVDAK